MIKREIGGVGDWENEMDSKKKEKKISIASDSKREKFSRPDFLRVIPSSPRLPFNKF